MDSQYAAAYDLAEDAVLEIMGIPAVDAPAYRGRALGCGLVWRRGNFPPADGKSKISMLAIAWRTGAKALRRLQARYCGGAWRHGVASTLLLLERADARIGYDGRRADWTNWLQMVRVELVAGESRAAVGQLAALAASRGLPLARQDAEAARAAFQSWLQEGPAQGWVDSTSSPGYLQAGDPRRKSRL